MTPKEQAIHDAVAAIKGAVSRSLDTTLPKVLSETYAAGGLEALGKLQDVFSSMQAALDVSPAQVQSSKPLPPQTAGTPGKDGRAPRGSVRRAVLTVLLPKPAGLTAAEVVARAQEIDPSISAGGIHNELNRQKGMIYENEDGRWRTPPELKLGGDYYDLNELRNPERERATEPHEL